MSLRTPLLLLVLALMGLVATPALAVDDYPEYLKNAPMDSIVDPWGGLNRECTSFVGFRLDRDGTQVRGSDTFRRILAARRGTLAEMQAAVDAAGATMDNVPTPGSIAIWFSNEAGEAGPAGHVAYVQEAYPDGSALVEEYNWGGDGLYHTGVVTPPRVIHFPRGSIDVVPTTLTYAYGNSFGGIDISIFLERASSVQATLRRGAISHTFPARSFAAGDSNQSLRVPAGWAKGPAVIAIVVRPADGTPPLSFTRTITLRASSGLGTAISSLNRRPGSLGVSFGLAQRSLVSVQLRQGKRVVRLKPRWVAAGRARALRIAHPGSWAAKNATVTLTVRANARAKPTTLRRSLRL